MDNVLSYANLLACAHAMAPINWTTGELGGRVKSQQQQQQRLQQHWCS
jgi:hypothetical protein